MTTGMRQRIRFVAAALLAVVIAAMLSLEARADPKPPVTGSTTSDWMGALAKDGQVRTAGKKPEQKKPGAKAVEQASSAPKVERRIILACGENYEWLTTCGFAVSACQNRGDGPGPLMYVQERKAVPGAQWATVNSICDIEDAPPEAPKPPPVPTMGQIQEAFRRLPFSKPTVKVEPKGNVTLVNLPTYYEATWPGDSGLEPGEVSAPVKLLSWSVEFKVDSHSYDFHYGDGTSSGTVEDAGGGYPEGSVKHTYTKPIEAAAVSVDSRLTGQFRVNGGEWVDIDTIADLQNEPVTTLQVREAKARLYTN